MGYKKQFISGVSWNSVAKILTEILLVAQLAIVARYIDKSDFGLMSIVHVVLGLTTMFSDLGMWAAMMHKQGITDNQYRSIYWFNWLISIVVFFVICISALIAAFAYNEDRLIHLIMLTGVGVLISPFGKIFIAIKTKNLEFQFLSIVNIGTKLLTFVFTVIFCILNFGVYSLIFPGLIGSIIGAIIYVIEGRKYVKISFHYNFDEIRDFFKIGIYDTGAQLMDYLSYKIDVLLVGHFFGMSGLGLYNMGKELALKTMKIVAPIINPVLTPIFAKIQNDNQAVKDGYLRILNFISFFNFPILFALFIFAEPVVELFLSEKYIESANFVKILCFWGMFASVGNPSGTLVVAKGRTDLSFKWTVIRFCCVPITVFLCSYFGIYSVAYAQVALQIAFFYIYWRILIYPLSDIMFKEYIGALYRPFIICLLASIPTCICYYMCSLDSLMLKLVVGCLVFSATYLTISYYMNRVFVNYIINFIKK